MRSSLRSTQSADVPRPAPASPPAVVVDVNDDDDNDDNDDRDGDGDGLCAIVDGLFQDAKAIDERNRQLMQRVRALQTMIANRRRGLN